MVGVMTWADAPGTTRDGRLERGRIHRTHGLIHREKLSERHRLEAQGCCGAPESTMTLTRVSGVAGKICVPITRARRQFVIGKAGGLCVLCLHYRGCAAHLTHRRVFLSGE